MFKKMIFAAGLALAVSMPTYADKHEKKAEPETKKVCVDVQGKDGKPVMDPKTNKPKQNCITVKVREKFEGTKIEDAKKK
jgi:N-acetylmuramoyl-L-alanine amidase CwlA